MSTILPTRESIQSASLKNGVFIKFENFGPSFKAEAFTTFGGSRPEIYLGYCEGFIRPTFKHGTIMHIDSMVVYKSRVEAARSRSRDQGDSNFTIGSIFGIGLNLGLSCLAHVYDQLKPTVPLRCEFLAIDDDPEQHKTLVRYYRRLGLTDEKYVGDNIEDIPSRLVWGGRGTLFVGEVKTLLEKWHVKKIE